VANILILDDTSEWHDLIKHMLKSEGHSLFHAYDETESFKQLHNSQIDLLIMDLFIPGSDWWEFYSLVKANPICSTIGIILMLPKIIPTDELIKQFKVLKSNGDEFLHKPFPVKELIRLVNKMLKRMPKDIE